MTKPDTIEVLIYPNEVIPTKTSDFVLAFRTSSRRKPLATTEKEEKVPEKEEKAPEKSQELKKMDSVDILESEPAAQQPDFDFDLLHLLSLCNEDEDVELDDIFALPQDS